MVKITTKDFTLSENNLKKKLTIKKDTPISISLYGLHMDEKYFPNPQKFDPERFRDDNAWQKYKYIYMPFGEGPRKCLGKITYNIALKLLYNVILAGSDHCSPEPVKFPSCVIFKPCPRYSKCYLRL